MNIRINQLVRTLLRKDSIEECSLGELKAFAERHPYFGAAQLLLAKKMQSETPEHYDEQLQKTFLFFHNPLWVEHLLNETGQAEIVSARPASESIVAQTVIEEQPPVIQEELQEPEETPEITTPVLETAINIPAPVVEEPITIHEEKQEEPIEVREDNGIISVVELAETSHPETPGVDETKPLNPSFAKNIVITDEKEDEPVAISDAEPPMEIPSLKIGPIDPAKAELVFEPYHTVDYFASQGIKFKEEDKPADKFTRQLRSFTDWLKTMKKLPVSEIVKTTEPATERKVEQMAEHSIKDREVLTEAMAEVWEKQGNAAKAIEIYDKLSLLDPAKSPYFAAKIEELKKKN